jgi:hypothetical protein
MDRSKNLLDGVHAQGALAKHELLARRGPHLDAGQTGAFLAAVVLLLHHEIELVEAPHPRAVLALVVFQRLEQSHHRDAAFML